MKCFYWHENISSLSILTAKNICNKFRCRYFPSISVNEAEVAQKLEWIFIFYINKNVLQTPIIASDHSQQMIFLFEFCIIISHI